MIERRERRGSGCGQGVHGVSALALGQLALALADHRHGAAEDPAACVVLAAGRGGRRARPPVPEPAHGKGRVGRRGRGQRLVAAPLLCRLLATAGGVTGAVRPHRRGGRSLGGVEGRLRGRPLGARVGGAEHLGGRHPEAGLRAASLLQQEGLEGVAAGGGLAKVALDGARLAGQRGRRPRGAGRRSDGGRLRVALGPGLFLIRFLATQDLALGPSTKD